MKLAELEPEFVRHESRIETWTRIVGDPLTWKPGDPTEEYTGPRHYQVTVDTLAEAQGIHFLCPKCFEKNGGTVGTHGVCCWSRSRGVPDDVDPGPGRWVLDGTGIDDLTLNAEASQTRSVQLEGGCAWHGYITNGEVTNA